MRVGDFKSQIKATKGLNTESNQWKQVKKKGKAK